MHELGTVFYVIKEVEKLCDENELTKVGSVTLQIGEVSGIIPEYIVDCWNWAIKESKYMQEAELKVETLEAVTFCEDCKGVYGTVAHGKICPYCGSDRTWLQTGNEVNIKEILVE